VLSVVRSAGSGLATLFRLLDGGCRSLLCRSLPIRPQPRLSGLCSNGYVLLGVCLLLVGLVRCARLVRRWIVCERSSSFSVISPRRSRECGCGFGKYVQAASRRSLSVFPS
jgi:hypothetical protein